MPHAVTTRNLGRSRSLRKATVRSLAQALLKFERIETTLARAKETQRLAERLITLGKAGGLSARRRAISLLNDPGLVARLFTEVAPRFSSRAGGYTRLLHKRRRTGDGASMVLLELVELAPSRIKGKKESLSQVKEPEAPRVAAPARSPSEPPPREKLPEGRGKEPEKSKKPPRHEEPEKPKGFLQGLRKFFKGRPKK